MGNSLAAPRVNTSPAAMFPKSKRRGAAAAASAAPRRPAQPKRRSRTQSGGVTSDCGTAASTTDSQAPRGSLSSVRGAFRRLSSGRRSPAAALDPTTEEDEASKSSQSRNSSSSSRSDHAVDQARRIREAEKILEEVAKEYAAKRAAGLVPTKPVPARTLLWEELERRAQRSRAGVGRRGTCVFGRDSEAGSCGCSTYRKLKKLPDGRENTGGVCACCQHGAPWHRLAGGTMAVTGSGNVSMTRASMRARARSGGARSRASSRNSQSVAQSGSVGTSHLPRKSSQHSMNSDYYDEYDDEYDSDEDSEDDDDDDEDIANEVARPFSIMEDPTPPLVHGHAKSEGDATALDRSSLFSNGDTFGLPPRLSSTSRHLDKLLGAIAKYRELGLSEDEIEAQIREDFPPTERVSYGGGYGRVTRASQ
ncbi:hypothetical protein BBJ28_00005398 [Nothophytophthora sp. Chile5]|nr:hypothetical protein BBJ28_00005398 [Nothophytophthora sp. Chile5]